MVPASAILVQPCLCGSRKPVSANRLCPQTRKSRKPLSDGSSAPFPDSQAATASLVRDGLNVSNNGWQDVMRVSLEIPEDLGRRIAADPGELPRAALEGLALEAIRAGKLTVSQARRLLGIQSRYEMDGFLKAHGVFLELTLEDVARDSEVARALRG